MAQVTVGADKQVEREGLVLVKHTVLAWSQLQAFGRVMYKDSVQAMQKSSASLRLEALVWVMYKGLVQAKVQPNGQAMVGRIGEMLPTLRMA